MTNTVYQAAVEELEAVLSPRLASRALQEGLGQVGKGPENVTYFELEKIFKLQVYRQLQVTMPVTQAKDKVADILERIKPVGAEQEAAGLLAQQKQSLAELSAALKPFNLYFEWPETQKLRAQLGLLESELDAGRNAEGLVRSAQEQLQILEQKLEDNLVAQARDLGDLENGLAGVKSLGGTKVRRLENLIGQIHHAQEERQLAPAEIERARKLVTDLRKLMQSSVVSDAPLSSETSSETTATATTTMDTAPTSAEEDGILDAESGEDELLSIDTSSLPDEVSAQLLLLDLEHEQYELAELRREYSNLLLFEPDWSAHLDALAKTLEQETSLGDGLSELRDRLSSAQRALRETLEQELSALQTSLENLDDDLATPERAALQQMLQVNLGVLDSTLPNHSDLQQIHHLQRLVEQQQQSFLRSREEAQTAFSNKYQQQQEALTQLETRLETTATRYGASEIVSAEHQRLAYAVTELRGVHQQERLAHDQLIAAREAEAELIDKIAQQTDLQDERTRAQLESLLGQLRGLPALDSLKTEREQLQTELSKQLAVEPATSPDDTQLNAMVALLEKYRTEVQEHYQRQLLELSERASTVADPALLGELQTANAALDTGSYPDLAELAREVQAAFERRLSAQLNDYHQLELESRPYQKLSGPQLSESVTNLTSLLSNIKQQLEAGDLTDGLERAWALLAQLREGVAARNESFEPRLDAALHTFVPISKLNSEESAAVQRILKHLDSQRSAFYKVSPSVQSQLEASLTEAETSIESLKEQFEATRAVAGQLVNNSALDDLLGIFGALDQLPEAEKAEAPPKMNEKSEPTPGNDTDNDSFNAWVMGYLAERGVCGAAAFDAHGDMLSGQLNLEVASLYSALSELKRNLYKLGGELEVGKPRLVTIETAQHIAIGGWTEDGICLLLILDEPAVLSLTLGKLRRELLAPNHSSDVYQID